MAMHVVRYRDPLAFRSVVGEYLHRDEPRHNLLAGLLATLIDQPDVYPHFHLWAVEAEGQVVGAALRTEPHNVVLSAPAVAGAVETLVDALVTENAQVPGVVGGLPEANVFVERYQSTTGAFVSSRSDQAIHVLTQVEEVPTPSGAARRARPDDLELILGWSRAFGEEAVPGGHFDEAQASLRVTRRLAEVGGDGYRIWADGEPVSLVGYTSAGADTARVGPVYTPPAMRQHGYATALTAQVSRELLESGMRYCLLYTDLANPTSNAIYRRIGYRRVCDAAMILFEHDA